MPPTRDRFQDPEEPEPLVTPKRVAMVSAVVLSVALFAYLLAFGGFSSMAKSLGFGGPALGPSNVGGNTPGPLQVCMRELGELKLAAAGTLQVMGELPSTKAIEEADGLPKIDPWGNKYRYHRTPDGRQFWFSSDGPDGIPDNTDDLETAKAP